MDNKKLLATMGLSILVVSLFVFVSRVWAHGLGRMTGGGSIFTDAADFIVPPGTRITHGFELHCGETEPVLIPPAEPNNLQINIHTPDGVDGRFHLETLDLALCRSGVDPSPPQAPFYWYEGSGTGRYNGQPGYCAEWVFTDRGEPGTADQIWWLKIWDCNNQLVVIVSPNGEDPSTSERHQLTFGNHQAHRGTGRP